MAGNSTERLHDEVLGPEVLNEAGIDMVSRTRILFALASKLAAQYEFEDALHKEHCGYKIAKAITDALKPFQAERCPYCVESDTRIN